MSQAPERTKQSTEKRTLSFDFTAKLKSGDSVSAVNSVTATPAGLTLSSSSLAANVVSIQVSGGAAGNRYDISCNVTTTPGGDILELDAIVCIDNLEN